VSTIDFDDALKALFGNGAQVIAVDNHAAETRLGGGVC
jgi:hypothetical protein